MKDFFTGMAVGVAVAGVMCCPVAQETLKKAEQKLKDVAEKLKSEKKNGASQPEQNGERCECGCDCACCDDQD